MKRSMLAVAMLASALALLAGCLDGKKTSEGASGNIEIMRAGLPDGRGVMCAIYAPNSGVGSIECDWANASDKIKPNPATPIAIKSVMASDGKPVLCAIYAPNSAVGSITCHWAERG